MMLILISLIIAAAAYFIFQWLGPGLGAWLQGLLQAQARAEPGTRPAWGYASFLESRKAKKFSGQLAAVLDLLSGALRSGQSLSQALQAVALEGPQPASEYFAAISQKLSLGEAPETSLEGLALRMQGRPCEEELRMLSTSVSVTRSSGGNLAEILAALSDTLRERARLRAEIGALTAQGKMSGLIVGGLPALILIALNLLDPSLVKPMFTTALGLSMLGAGLVLEGLGAFLIRRIVSVDV